MEWIFAGLWAIFNFKIYSKVDLFLYLIINFLIAVVYLNIF